MTNMPCTFGGDRGETLIAYLYNDIDPQTRALFDAHLGDCAACRAELDGLRGVRAQLSRWNPPEVAFANRQTAIGERRKKFANRRSPIADWTVPVWAQVAAALLLFGVTAGLANLSVQRDENGLTIRTHWSRLAAAQHASEAARADAAAAIQRAAELRTQLTALERQLGEVRAAQAAFGASSAKATRGAGDDGDLLRKVRALVDESERRQQRELALRLAQVVADVGAQRQADLRKIDMSLNGVQNSLGVEVLKQRQSLNYLMRVNQRQ